MYMKLLCDLQMLDHFTFRDKVSWCVLFSRFYNDLFSKYVLTKFSYYLNFVFPRDPLDQQVRQADKEKRDLR